MVRLRPPPQTVALACVIAVLIVLLFRDNLLPSSWDASNASVHTGLDDERVREGALSLAEKEKQMPTFSDFDIVVSYFEEPLDGLRKTVETVLGKLPESASHRVIIYYKGKKPDEHLETLLDIADEVVPIENVGREGETYLTHILRHYDAQATGLADHTFFLQPHIAWDWVMMPRLDLVRPSTGFLSFGPYITQTEGKDATGNLFPRIKDIYSAFRMDFSPPHAVLATWAGQFIVSRKRILDNKRQTYQNLWDKFHAPADHWIWKEGWWNNEPSNPTLGHALERSWPAIFACEDASIAETCGEGHGETCQCLD